MFGLPVLSSRDDATKTLRNFFPFLKNSRLIKTLLIVFDIRVASIKMIAKKNLSGLGDDTETTSQPLYRALVQQFYAVG